MFDRLKETIESVAESSTEQKNITVKVIGDRASGKTTYMAALARFPESTASNGIVQDIKALNDDGRELVSKAKNLLEQGLEFEPTRLEASADDNKDYQLTIALRGLSQFNRNTDVATRLNVTFRDYAGEFFSDLIHRDRDPKLTDYIEDCRQADGLMFLLDGSAQRKDAEYAQGVDKLLRLLSESGSIRQIKRIALVLTKCEQPDLWIKHEKPQKLAQKRFKNVCAKLSAWQATTGVSLEYFTASAFGVMGSPFQEANAVQLSRKRSGVTSIIKDKDRWKPFGLISPTYWIATGQRSRTLDEA